MKVIPTRLSRNAAFTGVAVVIVAVLAAQLGSASSPPDFRLPGTTPPSPASAPHSLAAQSSMIAIPAGTWRIGSDDAGSASGPAHQVSLDAFTIDRTEVTNAAFVEFLNALSLKDIPDFASGGLSEGSVAPEVWRLLGEGVEGRGPYAIVALDDDQSRIGGRDGRFVVDAGYEQHPVTETTWAGARAYCEWRGARLPTEVEWEVAARGDDSRLFPWGNEEPDPTRAFVSKRNGVTAAVGSLTAGVSPFGLMDMSGNLAEWTSTLKRPYPYDAGDGRENPDLPGERVTRGGDYRYDTSAATLSAVHRDGFSNAPERGHRHIGMRCAA
jgi:formylglycine-generating enzyme required for sulfatase activity